jgi:hypothetical protein
LFVFGFRSFPTLVALFAALVASPAWAWGPQGHEIVAAVALRELTPTARAEVSHLLGTVPMMVHEASWADEIREARPETGAWHYVDIPLAASGYSAARDCARGDCVVAQIDRDVRALSNHRLPDKLRAEALRFLIHFVADVHQPLHAEDNDDRGGNQVDVRIGRERANLHKVWDTDVVKPLTQDPDMILRGFTADQRQQWQSGNAARWAEESHAIARDQIYPPLHGARRLRLPRDYAFREAPLARIQLAKAGLRLAWLLNTALR